MPVEGLEPRPRELGRLRLGRRVAVDEERSRPSSIGTWRLTSPDRHLLEVAAGRYGGVVEEWDDSFELVTATDVLPVRIPPQNMSAGQWFELWKAGGLVRRCTGTLLEDGSECVCDPETRECRLTTHLLMVLPDLPDVGVWRLVTSSVYAARELPSTIDLLLNTGVPLPAALLAIDRRSDKKEGKTRLYNVPVLRIAHTLTEILELGTASSSFEVPAPGALPPPDPAELVGEPPNSSQAPPQVDPGTVETLQLLLNHPPQPGDIADRDDVESRLRSLFEAMSDANLWSANALAVKLTDLGVGSLSDVRDYDLVAFAQRAWIAADAKVVCLRVAS